MNLNDLHKASWDISHRGESLPHRQHLFDFRVVHGQAVLVTREQDDPSPLEQGQCYALRCRFHPVRRHGNQERPVSDADFPAWLSDLLARNGMQLLVLRQAIRDSVPMPRFYGKEKDVRMHTVLASFTVNIQDAATAAHAWQHGIGRRKAFGCGMLLMSGRSQ